MEEYGISTHNVTIRIHLSEEVYNTNATQWLTKTIMVHDFEDMESRLSEIIDTISRDGILDDDMDGHWKYYPPTSIVYIGIDYDHKTLKENDTSNGRGTDAGKGSAISDSDS